MKSEAKAAFVTGDGYIRYSWDDGEESGSYSLPIAVLYGLPHEDGALRQAAQPADGAQATERPMTEREIRQWIDACNHEPARDVLRHYLRLTSAPAQVGAQPAGRGEGE